MEPGLFASGQFDRQARGPQAGFARTDFRVLGKRNFVTELPSGFLLVSKYGRGVLAMGGNGRRRMTENLFQDLLLVHQHVSGRGSHEDFDPRDFGGIGCLDVLDVLVACPEEKSVVGDRVSIRDGAFFLQSFHVQGRGRDIGHFEKSSDPSGHRCPGFGPYAGLVSQSRFTKMNLVVDQSGQDQFAGCIDDLAGRRGWGNRGVDPFDSSLPHKDVLLRGPSFVHDPAPGNKEVAHSLVSVAGIDVGVTSIARFRSPNTCRYKVPQDPSVPAREGGRWRFRSPLPTRIRTRR